MGAMVACALVGTASAHASPELAQSSRCLACHQVDRKVVGPAFREVARRYANRADAATHLARKIREGGSGAWGAVPMAANPHVSEADAKRLAQWVLTLK
jgi:cytochrome c